MDDELQLSPDWNPDPERRSSTGTLAAAVAAVVLAAAGIAYFAFRRTPPPPPAPAPAAKHQPPPQRPSRPRRRGESAGPRRGDAFVRGQLLPLSASGIWSSWLGHDSLVRRFVAAVLSIAGRTRARSLAEVAASAGHVSRSAMRSPGRLVIDPATRPLRRHRRHAAIDRRQRGASGLEGPAAARRVGLERGGVARAVAGRHAPRGVRPPARRRSSPAGIDRGRSARRVYVCQPGRELEALSPAQKLIVRTGAANSAPRSAPRWRGLF
ncbi:MAG: hypothetical protein R2862_06820 [Thermoanaerobaculia bacterium]